MFSFETKRNLITNSSEFYNLSYEYINDCLRAGLVYRREFYTDSELNQKILLMFKLHLTPFGNLNTPSFKNEKKNFYLYFIIFIIFFFSTKLFKKFKII